MRLKELKALSFERLKNFDEPYLEGRLIILYALNISLTEYITDPERVITPSEEEKVFSLIEKRKGGTPYSYIVGKKEFYGNSFTVNESVLIPRPDTETLVEVGLCLAKKFAMPRILDLCTGSGAVAASVSKALSIDVSFSDISHEALSVAKMNYMNITGKKGNSRQGDLLSVWQDSSFDIILSNPPYLTESWWNETSKDVKSEPKLALVSDSNDGLDIVRRIIDESVSVLVDKGYLALEVDYRQIPLCGNLLHDHGFTDIKTVRDLSGKERVIYGRKETRRNRNSQ